MKRPIKYKENGKKMWCFGEEEGRYIIGLEERATITVPKSDVLFLEDVSKVEEFKEDALDTVERILKDGGDIGVALRWIERYKSCDKNYGFCTHRLRHESADLERAFHDTWAEKNIPFPQINNGHGILQDLLSNEQIEVTDRERRVVATIIQWLGTNIGQSFLYDVFKKCDMTIVRDSSSNRNKTDVDDDFSHKEADKYLKKYFKEQYISKDHSEYKSLVRILNKAQKQ